MSIWVDAYGWPIPPIVLLGCLVAEFLYFRGWQVLVKAEQKETARTTTSPELTSSGEFQWDSWFWRGAYFLGAIFIILLGDSAVVDTLSGRFFWVHMIQHLLLLVVLAPLLVAASPLKPLWLGLPDWARRLINVSAKSKGIHSLYRAGQHVWHWLRIPAISCALLIIGTWAWHWPTLYDLALTNEAIHDWCEHLTFLAVSVLFWTQVIPAAQLRPRLGYIGQLACLGVAIIQNVILAVVLGFAPVPLYAPYAHLATLSGGLSALQDQQLGAGIMWTFGDVPFVIAIFVLFQKWFDAHSDDATITLPTHQNIER